MNFHSKKYKEPYGELKAKPPVPPSKNKNMKDKKWNEDKVIDFVNWYVRLHKLGVRYELENQTIIDSFKNGDDYKVWH